MAKSGTNTARVSREINDVEGNRVVDRAVDPVRRKVGLESPERTGPTNPALLLLQQWI